MKRKIKADVELCSECGEAFEKERVCSKCYKRIMKDLEEEA